jgi:hypothetical protein
MMDSVKDISEFPSEPFFMIVWDDLVRGPSDYESTHTERVVRTQFFTTKQELIDEIGRIEASRMGVPPKIRVFGVEPLKFSVKVEIEV